MKSSEYKDERDVRAWLRRNIDHMFTINGQNRLFRFAVVVIVVLAASICGAAPFAEWLEGRSSSGAVVRIWGEGDEYAASFEAEDGHAVLPVNPGLRYCYAIKDEQTGALLPTDIFVGDESLDDRQRLDGIPLHLRDTSRAAAEERERRIAKADEELGMTRRWEELKAESRAIREMTKSGGRLRSPPSRKTLGNIVGLTVLVDFPLENSSGQVTNTLANTCHPEVTMEMLDELLNGESCTLWGNPSSVRKYFEDVSCGRMSYHNIVLGWFTAKHPREYYDDPNVTYGSLARELVGEVLQQIASDPQYSTKYLPVLQQLSYSGSYFRALNIWFAGPKSQIWSKGLWAHASSLTSTIRSYLPVVVDGETRYFSGYQMSPITKSPVIGTFCHENGHLICAFPDLYDYDTHGGGPVGSYSSMASGNPANPCYVDAYLRAAAGWVDPKELPTEPALLEVHNDRSDVWKYTNPFDSSQYYLIENRQKTGRDSNLPGGGILIWRCDEKGSNKKLTRQDGFEGLATNRVNAELSLEQADGLYEMERRIHTSDSNDLWFQGNTASGYGGVFSAQSSPAARWKDASYALVSLSNFSAKGDVMTFVSGDACDSPEPHFSAQQLSRGFRSLSFGVIATTFGKGVESLLVLADVESYEGDNVKTARTDMLGRLSERGILTAFTVDGLEVGSRHEVKLRLVQDGGGNASYDAACGSLYLPCDNSISTAVDAPTIQFWHSEGLNATNWSVATSGAYSNESCAKSGARTVSDASESKSVLHAGVVGPGTFTFYWKVSSESITRDWLAFSYDGIAATNKIGGSGGSGATWTKVTETIPAGEQVLTWTYRKNASVDGGSDCGWIDAVSWDPETSSSPLTPTGLSATKGTCVPGTRLTWNASANAARYAVYRSETSSSASASLVGFANGCEFVDSNCAADETMYYWVRALNDAGESALAGPVTGWRPSALVVTTTSLEYGVAGSSFEKALSAAGGRSPYTWSVADRSHLPTGLSLNPSTGKISGVVAQPFCGVVTFLVTDQNGTVASSDLEIEIRSATTPSVVQGLTLMRDYGRLVLSWNAQLGVDEYIVYRNTSSTFSTAAEIARTSATFYVDALVEEGVMYFYWIVAANWLGNGPQGSAANGASKMSSIVGDIYVHVECGNDFNDGSNWKKAKRSLQSAVDAATTGATVVVAPGTYSAITTDDRLMFIVSAEGPTATVIDGGGTNRCASLASSSSGTNTCLVGFTLTNGRAPGSGYVYGGGSYGGTLSRCIISNCVAMAGAYYAEGGGAYYGYLHNCLIIGNRASSSMNRAYGGGCYYSCLYNCTVMGNTLETAKSIVVNQGAGSSGGSIYNTVVWDNVLITADGALRVPDVQCSSAIYNSEIRSDPLFVDAATADCRLASNSPCKGAGSLSYVTSADGLDLAGNPRVVNGQVDVGAFQGAVAPSTMPAQVGAVRARSDKDACGIVLRWDAVPFATSYKVYRGLRKSLLAAQQTGETSGTSFVDTNVGLGGKYFYRIVPCNDFGDAVIDGATPVEVEVVEDGANYYVDAAAGNDEADGKTWASAKQSIASLASLLEEGDLVLVKPGRYKPIVLGGRTCEIRSTDGASSTFIDGEGTSRCASLSFSVNTGQTYTNAVLVGFSLVNGSASEVGIHNYGGGAYGGTLKWCTVSNCAATTSGNLTVYGGGTYYTYAYNSRIVDNIARAEAWDAYAGGAYCGYFYNCLFARNRVVSGSPSHSARGGGLAYGYTYCSTIVDNSAENTAGGLAEGGGIYGYYQYCSILWNNTAGVGPNLMDNSNNKLYYCCTPETTSYCSHCVTSPPLFVDHANGDWRLSSGSPCLDAGHNTYARTDLDLQGGARISGTKVDIGAYEGTWTPGQEPVAPLEIVTRIPPAGTPGTDYSVALVASGGVKPYSWRTATGSSTETSQSSLFSITSGGVLSGTPVAAGTYPISVFIEDSAGNSASALLSLAVQEAVGAYTTSTPVEVPYSWLDEYASYFGGTSDYESLAMTKTGKRASDGTPLCLWHDYVAGTNPTNMNSVFVAEIEIVDGGPVVKWSPDSAQLRAARRYRTLGKRSLSESSWTDITDKDKSEYRFFKIYVELK